MINVTICLGSNCGDRESNIKSTIGWLRELLIQVRCSDVYETPCAREGESKYLNAVMTGFFQGTGEGLEELLKDKRITYYSLNHIGDHFAYHRPIGVLAFTTENIEQMCSMINNINRTLFIEDQNGEKSYIKYTDFDYLREIYYAGLAGR